MPCRRKLISTTVAALLAAGVLEPAARAEPSGQDAELATALFPILERNRWGFIDQSGRVVIPARFRSTVAAESERSSGPADGHRQAVDLFMASDITPQSTAIVAVSLDGEWRFVDRQGTLLPPRFDQVGTFDEGLAPVRREAQWGFIDTSGRVAIPLGFDEVGAFRGGVAVVQRASRYGLIDAAGRWVVQPRFDSIRAADSVFHDNRALFTLFGKKGFVSRAGTIAVPPSYDDATPFAEGLAAVTRGLRTAYIDTSGRVVIPYRPWSAGRFARGRAVVQVNGKYGYIDRAGDYVATPQFHQAGSFGANDLAVAWKGPARGVVDLDGRWSQPRFEEIHRLDDSLSIGTLAGRIGLVRRATGEMVREYRWERVGAFSDGLARVQDADARVGFVDLEGRLVIPARFAQAARFDRGLCKAATRDTLGYIDPTGAWVWSSRIR